MNGSAFYYYFDIPITLSEIENIPSTLYQHIIINPLKNQYIYSATTIIIIDYLIIHLNKKLFINYCRILFFKVFFNVLIHLRYQ